MTFIYKKVEEDLSKVEEELDLQITGTERPSIYKVWTLVLDSSRWQKL
jgi:hypothetical protein